jgi:hypothetical protein
MVDANNAGHTSTLLIPRGIPGLSPMSLDMGLIYAAENRLSEVSMVSPGSAPELIGYFNEACNTTTKYLAWVEYEILMAHKHFDLAKAHVILEKAPEAYSAVKDKGIKFNEDFRSALVTLDHECQSRLDVVNALQAVKALLEAKAKSFERAYYACKTIWDKKNSVAAMPNLSGLLETPSNSNSFIGERKR